jgi:dephospho-CoA kinase
MILIGLTGGIGMGKSTAAAHLERLGLAVVDTDQLAREIVEPGQPALAEIQQTFGPGVMGTDGRLRRGELARLVFEDDAKRRQLEAILHPRIRQLWLARAQTWRAEKRSMGVVIIPLLFETGAANEFGSILCVACSAASQRQRLQARGWTSEQIGHRLAAQWPAQKKMDLAHHVIWTEPKVDVHASQLERVIKSLASR